MIQINPPFEPSSLALAALLLCLGVTTFPARVQAQIQPAGTLREVVVSASRQEQFTDDLPVSLDVVDEAEMEQQQIQDIRDAVRDLPNISVPRGPSRFTNTGASNATGRDGNSGFSIRGLGGNRVLMMVDGIRLPRSYIFGSNAFGRDSLSLDLVKRIEVLRGPASALYGSDGMAGLVNAITYEPEDLLKADDGSDKTIGGRVSTAWTGDDDGLSVGASLAGSSSESLKWLLSASARRAHGLETMGTVDTSNVNRTTANPQNDRGRAWLGKLVYRPSAIQKHVFALEHVSKKSEVHLLSSIAASPYTGTASQIANAVLDERATSNSKRDRFTWDARFQLDAALADQVQTVVGVQRASSRQIGYSDLNTSPDRVRDVSYAENTWQASIQADKTTPMTGGWAQKLTYGLDHQTAKITNLYTGVSPLPPEVFPLKRFPDTRESSTALYGQVEWIDDHWSVVPGVRVDHFSIDVLSQDLFYPPAKEPARSLSGSAVSPKLGVMYRATPAWSVFGNYADGFRAPNANQVNAYFDLSPPLNVQIIPNPNLKPEKSRNLEFGVRGRLSRLDIDVAAFTGEYDNLIVDNKLISSVGLVQVFQTVNIDKARIRGFEVKGSYNWGVLMGGQLDMPFSYGQAKGTNSLTGAPLNSIEPVKFALGLNYQRAEWSLRLDLRHHAAKTAGDIDSSAFKNSQVQLETPSATTLDLTGQWRFRKYLRLTAGIVNLTNRKYWMWSDVRGLAASTTVADAYTQPGRHVNLSLVMDF